MTVSEQTRPLLTPPRLCCHAAMSDAVPFRAWVEEVNHAGGTYHRMELGHGLVLDGEYDMTRHVDRYGIPADLTGKTVLGRRHRFGVFRVRVRSARRSGHGHRHS